VKPSDHPEFFRLPPPEGRSRESTIVLDAEGRFWHDGALVEHAGMARAFATWIDTHPDDGRYILNNGYDWTYFTVEDVPFFVLSVALPAPGEPPGTPPELRLSDGTAEPLDASRLSLRENGALYAEVKGGAHRARFSRTAQLDLLPLLGEDGAGEFFLDFGGSHQPIPVAPQKA
jgi:hypothetical protein